MHPKLIFIPVAGMFLLTLAVWVLMYFRRLSMLKRENIDPETLKRTSDFEPPPYISFPSDNFKNLFEMPVLFYAVTAFLVLTGTVDGFHIICAFGFFVFRLLHSIIHCTVNWVVHRFAAYVFASLFLVVMLVRFSIEQIAGVL